MRTRIFMVDDEADLVWTTTRHFQRELPDFDFQGFSDPVEALKAFNEKPPHLLITDLRMKALDGLELVRVVRERSPDLMVLVVTAYGTPEIRQQALELGVLEIVEKPFDHRWLLQRVQQALARLSTFSGQLSLPMLSDLVQILALSRRTGSLRVSQGDQDGKIWFHDGQVVHAAHDGVEGRSAFQELMRFQRGKFQMGYDEEAPVRSIDEPLEGLLLDSLRLIDEENKSSELAEPAALASQPLSEVLRRAEHWQQLPASAKQLGRAPFLALVSVEPGTSVVLEADEESVIEHAAPWIRDLVRESCALNPQATRGSSEWHEVGRAWAMLWDLRLGAIAAYGEARGDGWQSSEFRRRVSRVVVPLFEESAT
ncbi:MAG: response regulator [Acidobacteriota bacterium]